MTYPTKLVLDPTTGPVGARLDHRTINALHQLNEMPEIPERPLATIEIVDAISPIEKADNVEIAHIKGWELVIEKGEVAAGEQVLYFEIDSLLPVDDARFAFLAKRSEIVHEGIRGHVLGTARIQGVWSQGLAISLTHFPELDGLPEGTDLAAALGIIKYEEPIPEALKKTISGGFPKQFAPKTSATRVQNLDRALPRLRAEHQWIATEKLDGCLLHSSPILMADGSSKLIKDIVVGDLVMGFEDGAMVPTLVLNTFRNGMTSEWLCVRGTRESRGRGSADFSIKATPNHQFWVEGHGYRPAGELQPGDTLLCTHSDLSLTRTQEAILLGMLLGDGSLIRRGETAALTWSHSIDQLDYLEWSVNALGSIARRTGKATSGYGSHIERAMTLHAPGIADLFEGFDTPNGSLPERVADMLTPLALAYWYMDDGSLSHNDGQEDRASLSTHALDDDAQKTLRLGLQRLGIESVSQSTTKGNFIRVNADSADLMFSMIAPYIPPSMQYKLPSYYRGCPGWVPPHKASFKEVVGPVTVTSVEPYVLPSNKNGSAAKRMKFDIETGTHNFFVSRILVHNSSTTFINDNGVLRCAGRGWEYFAPKNLSEATAPWLIAHELNLQARIPVGYTIQGELVGPGVLAKNTLKLTQKKFFIFNVLFDGKFLPREQWPASLIGLSVPVVDVQLPETVAEMLEQVSGMKSLINPAVQAEGIVWHNTAGTQIQALENRTGMKAINNKWLVKHS